VPSLSIPIVRASFSTSMNNCVFRRS